MIDVQITTINNNHEYRFIHIYNKYAAMFVAGLLKNEEHYICYDSTLPIGVKVSPSDAVIVAAVLANSGLFTYSQRSM